MKRILSLFILIVILFAVVGNGQGTQIRSLPAASSVNSGDMFPGDAFAGGTYKYTFSQLFGARTITCTAPLLCAGGASMNLSADRTLSLSGPNSATQNVACVGTSADTTNINAAITSLQASGCGVLHLSGNCLMANSIVNNPGVSASCPLVLEGDGRSSTIAFSSCASGSGDCIFLGAQGSMGGGHNDGSGIRHLSIYPAAGGIGIHLKNLQSFDLADVYVEGGATAMKVEESRFGHVSNFYSHGWTSDGIDIVGENYASNWFTDVDLVSSGVNGFNYTKTGTNDAGGIYLTNVIVNGSLTGTGMLFSNTTANNVFVFCSHCVADGNFNVAGIQLKNVIMAYLTEAHIVNQAPGTGAPGLLLDGVFGINIMGGLFYGATGTGGADISLKNSVSRVVIDGTRLEGNQQAIKVDATTHSVDLRPSFYLSSTLTNDPTKIVPATTLYGGGRTLYTGTTKPSMFGMISPAGSSAQYSAVDSSGVRKYYADNGTTVLETLSQAGAAVFTSTLAASNLSGTNTGDQTITLTGDTTGSGTGSFATTLASSWKGWTDGGTTVSTTTSTDKVGIGVSSADSPLEVSANAAALQTPTLAGTLFHISNADGTNARGLFDVYGSAVGALDFRVAAGTATSPTAVGSGANGGQITWSFRGTTAYPSGSNASIRAESDEAQTDSAHGTRIAFYTAALGTSSAREVLRIDSGGHLISSGTAPTVACAGTGTSPSAPTIDSGGTDLRFTVTVNTGTGSPGSTGTCTVTFASAFSAVRPIVCMLVKGAAMWGNTSQVQETTESASAPVFTWTNSIGGAATALTVSTSYKFSCITIG